jgi:hypothetical protein
MLLMPIIILITKKPIVFFFDKLKYVLNLLTNNVFTFTPQGENTVLSTPKRGRKYLLCYRGNRRNIFEKFFDCATNLVPSKN